MKRAQLLNTHSQISSIWAKGCMLIMCVLSDLICLPLLGVWRKSWYIIMHTFYSDAKYDIKVN